jgi:hypothetical protein
MPYQTTTHAKTILNLQSAEENGKDNFDLPDFFHVPGDRALQIVAPIQQCFGRDGSAVHEDLRDAYEAAAPDGPQEEALFWHVAGKAVQRFTSMF